jgi:ATP/maltotriose-dependent transcriptional regulator MalT
VETTLLSTKLFVPPIRERLVARPRLAAILSNALGKGFTLISAPAGYGKTTLVSSWLYETGISCAWLSLEESDNDPVRFLQYMLTALQAVVPTIRLDLLDMVEGIHPAPFQALMSILINEITRQSGRFVLVMDDFHLIHDQFILDSVAFLLDHLPAQQMQIVMITRSDPPLPLSRLRVRNQMVEIRAEQLRFTPVEVATFVNDVMGLDLPIAEISAIHERTEGWIAGLQLAGLSMQDCQDISGFISSFTGNHHYILDYLADEVLRLQDEPTRLFLLETSILSRMCASLCDSLLQTEDEEQPLNGQDMLENLEKRNLFIIPLDKERCWYRYHHLFADALNRRLEHLFPDLLPILFRKASAWYERNGLFGEAIQYALSAGDQERAAQLVEQNGCYLLMSGELITLLKWMDAVEPYFQAHPWLVIQKGWALTLAGRIEPAEQVFQTAEQLVSSLAPSPDVSSMIGTISAGRAYCADIEGNTSESARLAGQALDLLPDTDPLSCSMRSVATGVYGKTIFLSGDLERARLIYDQALEIGKTADNVEMVINTTADICDLLLEQGRLGQAAQLLIEALPMTLRPDGQRLPLSAGIYSRLSSVYYEWNQLEQAQHFAEQCLEISRQWGNLDQQAIANIVLGKVEQAKGNLEKAGKIMSIAYQINRDNRLYPWISYWIQAALNRFWLSLGSMERVSKEMQAQSIDLTGEITFLHELRYVSVLRLLLVSGDLDATLGLVQRMLAIAEQSQRMARVVELLILQSLAYLGKKDFNKATDTLSRAVALAQPERFTRVFVDEGEGVRKLLFLVKSNPDVAGYANELLDAFGPGSGHEPDQGQLLIKPLSEREIEVLKLIQSGLSNQEIGSKLYISMGTVKRHISNIYSKLDVKTRTQAISRGKELGFF